jgi:hypothetical protein
VSYLASVEDIDAPDPLDTVTLLKSDFNLLQAAANAAMEDYQNLLELLELTPPDGVAPRQFMHDVVLPMIATLMTTQHNVNLASSEILKRAERFGNKTITKNGITGIKVGEKIPGLFDTRPRRERRGRG